MYSIRQGLLAGIIAGFLQVCLLFIDEGPGDQFSLIAQSFTLNGGKEGRWVAALFVFVLGALVGVLFGVLLRGRSLSRAQLMLCGLLVGVGWWVVFIVILAGAIERLQLSVYALLLYLVLSLVYGMVLGNVYGSMQRLSAR